METGRRGDKGSLVNEVNLVPASNNKLTYQVFFRLVRSSCFIKAKKALKYIKLQIQWCPKRRQNAGNIASLTGELSYLKSSLSFSEIILIFFRNHPYVFLNTPDRVLLTIKSSAYISRATHFERARNPVRGRLATPQSPPPSGSHWITHPIRGTSAAMHWACDALSLSKCRIKLVKVFAFLKSFYPETVFFCSFPGRQTPVF
jgi:hypothetical protein